MSAVGGVMNSAHPLAGRKIQFSDNEDNTDRVTQVQLEPDGSLSMLSDSTSAVKIEGAWKPAVNYSGTFLFLEKTLFNDVVFVSVISFSIFYLLSFFHFFLKQEDGKVGFILERFYSDSPTSNYSMTRIYEGTFIVSGRNIRGEGK